jgi:hypothetical protein
MESEQGLKIYQFTLGGTHEKLGTVSLQNGKLNCSSTRVLTIIEYLRESHFSSKATDADIYNELPFILRGLTYCKGIEASDELGVRD